MKLFKVIIKKKADNARKVKRIKLSIYLSILIISLFCNFKITHANIQIAAGYGHTVGLKSDGTVVATVPYYLGDYGHCNVSRVFHMT